MIVLCVHPGVMLLFTIQLFNRDTDKSTGYVGGGRGIISIIKFLKRFP